MSGWEGGRERRRRGDVLATNSRDSLAIICGLLTCCPPLVGDINLLLKWVPCGHLYIEHSILCVQSLIARTCIQACHEIPFTTTKPPALQHMYTVSAGYLTPVHNHTFATTCCWRYKQTPLQLSQISTFKLTGDGQSNPLQLAASSVIATHKDIQTHSCCCQKHLCN